MATEDDVADFWTRFPELSEIPDTVVSPAIDEADVWLGNGSNWNPADFPTARMLWAAHLVQLNAQQSVSADLGGGGTAADMFASKVKFGEREVTFAQRSSTSTGGGKGGIIGLDALLMETIYGQRFLLLRNRNIMPIAIV